MDCAGLSAVDEVEVPCREAGLTRAQRVGKIEPSAEASWECHLPHPPPTSSAHTKPAGDRGDKRGAVASESAGIPDGLPAACEPPAINRQGMRASRTIPT
jgi:hypothetical protein